jgi:ABC-type transporter Mla subunit MlaD
MSAALTETQRAADATRSQMEELSRGMAAAVQSGMDGVVVRFEGMIANLAQQHAKQVETTQAIAEASRGHAEEFGNVMARAGRDALGRVLRDTRVVLEQSHASSDSVRKNMAEAGDAVATALTETQRAAQATRAQMEELSRGMAAAAQSGQTLHGIADKMGRTVTALESTVARIGQVGTAISDLLASLQQVQGVQAQLMDRMQTVWPELLAAVTTQVRDSTQTLGASWAAAATQLEKATATSVARLAESVEELSANVDALKKLLGDQTRHAAVPPPPPSPAAPMAAHEANR